MKKVYPLCIALCVLISSLSASIGSAWVGDEPEVIIEMCGTPKTIFGANYGSQVLENFAFGGYADSNITIMINDTTINANASYYIRYTYNTKQTDTFIEINNSVEDLYTYIFSTIDWGNESDLWEDELIDFDVYAFLDSLYDDNNNMTNKIHWFKFSLTDGNVSDYYDYYETWIAIAIGDVDPPYATLIGNGEPLNKYVENADFSYHFSNDVLNPDYAGDTPVIEWVLHDSIVNENASFSLYYTYSSEFTPQSQWLKIDTSSPYIITSLDATEENWTNEIVALGIFLYLTDGLGDEPDYLRNVRYWFYFEITDGVHTVSYWTSVDFGTYLVYDIFRWGDMYWVYTGLIIGAIAAVGITFIALYLRARKRRGMTKKEEEVFDPTICETLDCTADLPEDIKACEECKKRGLIKEKTKEQKREFLY